MVSPLMPFTPVKIRNGRRPITPRSIPVSTVRKRRLAEVAWDATSSPLPLPRNMKAREPASQPETEEGSPKGRARKRIKTEIRKEETPKVTKAETKKETHEKSGQELHKSHKKDGGSSDSEKCKVESG